MNRSRDASGKMRIKKAAGLERKPAALELISCTSDRLPFALFKLLGSLNRLGFETRYTNRSRDPGEKCHHSGDALTISFRRFKSISEAAFFVTFCIKCRSKISATAAEQTKTRLSSLFYFDLTSKRQRNSAPPIGESPISIFQPWAALNCCTTARPSPLPPVLTLREASNR